MATGRLTLGFFTQNEQIPRYILTLFGLSFLFFTGLYSLNLGALTYIAIYLAGISLSALLPLMITLAGLLYPDAAGTVLGAIKVAAPLGGIVIPVFISTISKSVSFQTSLFVFPVAFLLAFVLLFLEIRHNKISVSKSPVIR
jgi:MFS family permease